MKGTFYINGRAESLEFSPSATLLELLRGNRHTDVKNGCEAGTCGACAVLLDGELVLSCKTFAASALERKIITVSGLGDVHNPHPIQSAFVDSGAVQCGFCTPGKVLATFALLLD
jgi:carbon-monoxide dehydrogenase small subunit